jgi:hypothetical protein
VSLIKTRRVGGRVRNDHVASLGAIALPPDPLDRMAFWRRLHDRLAKLGNRIDAETRAKLLAAIHARVPMVTSDEQRAVQLANAESDEWFWSSLHDMHGATIEEHKGLIAKTEHVVATRTAEMAKADTNLKAAQERIERLKRGESVEGGIGKPIDYRKMLLAAGFTEGDLRRFEQVHELSRVGTFEELQQEVHKRREQSERAVRKRRDLG